MDGRSNNLELVKEGLKFSVKKSTVKKKTIPTRRGRDGGSGRAVSLVFLRSPTSREFDGYVFEKS